MISYEEYHPYGTSSYRAVNASITASAKRYRYTGKERDEETGLYFHGARYYACWLGRWTASDPIGLGDGVNRFAYVSGNPVKLRDPSGTFGDPGDLIQRGFNALVDAQTKAVDTAAALGEQANAVSADAVWKLRGARAQAIDLGTQLGKSIGLGDVSRTYLGTATSPLEYVSAVLERAGQTIEAAATVPKRLDEGVQETAASADRGDTLGVVDGLAKSAGAAGEITLTVVGTGAALGGLKKFFAKFGKATPSGGGGPGRGSRAGRDGSGPTPGGGAGEVGLDNNALVNAIEGSGEAVTAMGRRTPVVSPTAAREFLRGSGTQRAALGTAGARSANAATLREFLQRLGGRIGAPSTRAGQAAAEASGARQTARNIKAKSDGDPGVISSTIEDGINLLTRDKNLLKNFPFAELF